MVDRISSLPDDLLCHILSFLPTQLALTTTILSKRWTSLVYSLSVLRFDDETLNHSTAFSRFCYGVNTVMHHPRFSSNMHLKMFLLNCYCGTENVKSHSFVESSLEAAKQRSVEEVHLTLKHQRLKPTVFVSRTFVVLKLNSVGIHADTSCVHLPSLKTLVLTFVSFEDRSDYVNFLSACPILEDLYVKYNIYRNKTNHDENNAPMNSLTLVRAEIYSADVLFNGINNVEFLRIGIGCRSQKACFKVNPVFSNSNLIHVQLLFRADSLSFWDGVVELLRCSPKLQILYIKKSTETILFKKWKWPISVIECVSSHLRSCTILSYDGCVNEIRFAAYILKNASVLEDMKIRRPSNVENQIIEQLSSSSRISPRCKLTFI